jgi:hypothetical protein
MTSKLMKKERLPPTLSGPGILFFLSFLGRDLSISLLFYRLTQTPILAFDLLYMSSNFSIKMDLFTQNIITPFAALHTFYKTVKEISFFFSFLSSCTSLYSLSLFAVSSSLSVFLIPPSFLFLFPKQR